MGKFRFKLPKIKGLSPQQRRAIDSDEDVLVTGVPGSGKTVVSIYRLKKTNSGMLLTYGKLLRKTLEQKVNDPSKTVVNIHRWLYDEMPGKEFLKYHLADENLASTISYLKSKGVQFDKILVDEGQDLPPNSYKLFKELSSSVSVGADEAQKVTEECYSSDESDIKEILPHLRSFELDIIYRTPYEIYDFARQFVPYNARANSTNTLERLKTKNAGANKPFIYIVDESKDVFQIMREIINNDTTANIGILCEDKDSVKNCANNLKNEFEFSCYHSDLKGHEEKSLLENDLKNIIITTLKSAKGIEFDIVIIHEFQNAREFSKEEYFVGVTRAKSAVHLISMHQLPDLIADFDTSTYKLYDRK